MYLFCFLKEPWILKEKRNDKETILSLKDKIIKNKKELLDFYKNKGIIRNNKTLGIRIYGNL